METENKLNLGGFYTYKLFKAIRLHFVGDYDYFKYGIGVKDTAESFICRPDKYSFVKLGRMFSNEFDAANFIAVNFYHNPKIWIRDLFKQESKERYKSWKDRQENCLKYLVQDLEKIKDLKPLIIHKENEYPELFGKIHNEINIDTFLILDFFMHISEGWNKKFNEDIVWRSFYKPYLKYRPFVLNYKYFDSSAYKQAIKNSIGVIDVKS